MCARSGGLLPCPFAVLYLSYGYICIYFRIFCFWWRGVELQYLHWIECGAERERSDITKVDDVGSTKKQESLCYPKAAREREKWDVFACLMPREILLLVLQRPRNGGTMSLTSETSRGRGRQSGIGVAAGTQRMRVTRVQTSQKRKGKTGETLKTVCVPSIKCYQCEHWGVVGPGNTRGTHGSSRAALLFFFFFFPFFTIILVSACIRLNWR